MATLLRFAGSTRLLRRRSAAFSSAVAGRFCLVVIEGDVVDERESEGS